MPCPPPGSPPPDNMLLKPLASPPYRDGRALSFFMALARHYLPNSIAKMAQKARVLIVGTGGIGTMSAYALEQGGKAQVTAVMRSNYDAVVKNGINIDSVQYGQVKGWRPSHSK